MTLFAFTTPPAPGHVVMLQGQRYVLTTAREHTRRDGSVTAVLTWSSHCAVCGAPFVATSPMKAKYLTRRCVLHRQPGIAVADEWRLRQRRSRHYG